ncbi:hypothetical protein [Actinacidiphila glaucinigra]|nr:hypothetical protein [Actinacidiphila glaucinigra]
MLSLVWLLGNSAAVPLLWMQVAAAQHDIRPPTALSSPDVAIEVV